MNKELIIKELHKNVINKHVLRVDGDKNEWTLSGDFLQKLENFIKEKLEQQKKEYERAEILGVQLLFKKSRTKKDLENLIEFSKNDVKYSNNVIKICEEKIKQME